MKILRRSAIGRATIAVAVIVLIALAGVAAYYYSTSGTNKTTSSTGIITSTTTTPAGSTATPYKVAVIWAGAPDNFFAEFASSSVQQAANALSTPQVPITVTIAYNVPSSQIVSVTSSYAQQGYKLMILELAYLPLEGQIAKANPGVYFVGEESAPHGFNASTFNYQNPFGTQYTYNATNLVGWDINLNAAYYVAGVAAGLTSHSDKVGFISAFNLGFTAQGYNNFAAGVHSVKSSLPVYYGFSNDWSDPSKGAAQTDAMVARGVDVISVEGDTQGIGAVKEGITKGIYGIPYPSNLNNLSSTFVLGSVYLNFTGIAWQLIHDAQTNTISGHWYSLDIAHHGEAFVLNQPLVTSGTISSAAVAQINAAIQATINYSYKPTLAATFPAQPP